MEILTAGRKHKTVDADSR